MSIFIMILLLSVLILVHELGHFLAARAFGIRVDKFALGMPIGPTLWEKKIGDTTYLIHAFLLGGYVSFPDDDEDSELPQDSYCRYCNKPIWQKMVVISAGVFANIITAFVLVFMVASLWGNLPSGKYETYIDKIIAPEGASVWESGLEPGDKIVDINGSAIDTKYGLRLYGMFNAGFDGKVTEKAVEENYDKLKRINHAFMRDEIIPAEVLVRLPDFEYEKSTNLSRNTLKGVALPQIKEVELNEKQTKLRDEIQDKAYIISNGDITLNDIAYAMSDGLKPLNFTIERGGEVIILNPVFPNKEGLIGVEMNQKEILTPTRSLGSIIGNSCRYLYHETYSMLVVLKQLFTGKIPLKNLHGVVLITKMGGDIIKNSGIYYGLLLTAMISMNLAIINFLPFPALDGGHFMFLVMEKVTGKKPDEKILNAISNVGFWILIAFMMFIIFNDIFVLVTAK